jgi:hypothetical protein
MIGKSIIGRSFERLCAYVTRVDASLNRESIQIDNLSSIETAAREMRRFAEGAKRCNRPAWHLIFGWHPEEFDQSLSSATVQAHMMKAARAVVKELGLSDHQTLYAAHFDQKSGLIPGARHWETHVVINRVGPGRRVASSSWDFARVEKAVAVVAEQAEMRQVPGRFNGVERADGFVANRVGEKARKEADRSGRETFADELKQNDRLITSLRDFREANDAAGFFRAMELHGVGVRWHLPRSRRAKRGLVVFDLADPQRSCAFSCLDSPMEKWGHGPLEKAFGPETLVQFIAAIASNEQVENSHSANKSRGRIGNENSERWVEFVRQRDEISSNNRILSAERHRRIREIESAFRKRQRKMHQRIRDDERALRRVSLCTWPVALMVNIAVIFIRSQLLKRARRRAIAACADADKLYAERRREPISWTSFKRQHDHAARTEAQQKVLTIPPVSQNTSVAVVPHIASTAASPIARKTDPFNESHASRVAGPVTDLPASWSNNKAAPKTMSEFLKELNSQWDQSTPKARTTHQQAASRSAPSEDTKTNDKSASVSAVISPREPPGKATSGSSKPANIVINRIDETADNQRLFLQALADAQVRFKPDVAPTSTRDRGFNPKSNNEIPASPKATPVIVSNVHGPNDSKHEKFEESKNALGRELYNDQSQGPTASKVDVEKIPPKILFSKVTKSFQSSPANQSLSFSLAKASAAMRQPKTAIQQRLRKYEGPSR